MGLKRDLLRWFNDLRPRSPDEQSTGSHIAEFVQNLVPRLTGFDFGRTLGVCSTTTRLSTAQAQQTFFSHFELFFALPRFLEVRGTYTLLPLTCDDVSWTPRATVCPPYTSPTPHWPTGQPLTAKNAEAQHTHTHKTVRSD